MKKGIIFLFLIALVVASVVYAEDHWIDGYAHNYNGTVHLTGWTIKCYSTTYGVGIPDSVGYFQIMYDYRPTTPGTYYLTADSTGKSTLYSGTFYYSGSGQIAMGNINFNRNVPDL